MNRFFSLLILLPILAHSFLWGQQEVKISDRAIVRLQGEVVFLSDFQQLLTDVKHFRCAVPQSFLLEVTVLGPYQTPELAILNENNLDSNLELVEKLTKLYNLRAQVLKREIHSGISEKQQEIYRKKFFTSACGGAASWRSGLAQLFFLDDYLQERFKDGDLTLAEKNAWKLKNLTISAGEIEKRIVKKEREARVTSAQNYLNTLNEQLTGQKYY